MFRIPVLLALAAAVALAAAAPTLAPAADPMPCRGVSFTDTDDAPANRNIREGWFALSEGRLTANLRLEQVDQQLAPGELTASFVMYYGVRRRDGSRGGARFAAAKRDDNRWSFEYGNDDGSPPSGATTGAVQPGLNGVIEIEIPRAHAVEGDTLASVHARTFVRGPANPLANTTDYAPDGPSPYGADFLAEPCPTPTPTPTAAPSPTPTPAPPTPGPQPQTPSGPPSDPPATPNAPKGEPAPFTVRDPRLRARTLSRSRSFRVVVDPASPVKNLVVTLRRGNGPVLARGRRASLRGPASVKVGVSRRIARGTYRLTISGRTAAGTTVRSTVPVRVG